MEPPAEASSPPPAPRTRAELGNLAALLIPMALVIVLDRATKWWVRSTMWEPPRTVIVVPGWLELTPVVNRGIAFGLAQETGGVLAIVAVLVLGLVAARNWRRLLGAPLSVRICLGLIAGGAIGNLIDRAQLGYVSDFIRVPRIPLFQVFNVADAAIVVGTVALVLATWRVERRAPVPSEPPAEPPPGPAIP